VCDQRVGLGIETTALNSFLLQGKRVRCLAAMQKSKKLTILFAGMIAADPNQGGATWAVLQYLLGFRRLGHEVIFVEPIKASALRANGSSFESSENARYFQETIREFGLDQQAALLLTDTHKTVGLTY